MVGLVFDGLAFASDRVLLERMNSLTQLKLPSRARYFPVQAPYRVSSDLSKLKGSLVLRDELFFETAASKLELLQTRPDSLQLPRQPISVDIWEEIWQTLGLADASTTCALGFRPEIPQPPIADRVAAASAIQRVWALQTSLALQEDWVLMSSEGKFEAGSVCFPSGWVPSEKYGLPLAAIHAPVADGEALRRASEPLTRAMREKGPFERFVWTLCRNSSLSRHPNYPADQEPENGSALYFRCERQVSVPLRRSGRALFLIRVYVSPLETALAAEDILPGRLLDTNNRSGHHRSAERLMLLKASLQSMTDTVIAYKSLREIRDQVLAMNAIS